MAIKISIPKINIIERLKLHANALITGFKEFIKPSRITVRYPVEKRWLPNRFRGLILLDLTKCIGCATCVWTCPVNAIQMYRAPNGRLYPGIRLSQCIFCHFCVDSCPVGALKATKINDLAFVSIKEMRLKPEDMYEIPYVTDESKEYVMYEFENGELKILKLHKKEVERV